jgi:hypothetical protein
MSADWLYSFLRRALDVTVWGGELVGDVELPPDGPAVFVANHAGALGPIGVVASLPLRLYPWIVGDMLDREKAGPYLRKDFVRPELHLPDGMATPVSTALSRITVPLLRGLGCIPVWHDRELMETYRISDEHLAAGRSLLVFPEDPELPIDNRTGLRPFKTGFAHLGSLYYASTHGSLSFYPIAVHRTACWVQLAAPITYNPMNAEPGERRRVAHITEKAIAGMLAEGGERIGVRMHAIC